MNNFLLKAAFSFAAIALFSCKASDNPDCIDPAKIKKDAICIEIYEPVCGCDGKTYGNSCVADNAGVTSYTKGECN